MWTVAKFDGYCSCGNKIPAGDRYFRLRPNQFYCKKCGIDLKDGDDLYAAYMKVHNHKGKVS